MKDKLEHEKKNYVKSKFVVVVFCGQTGLALIVLAGLCGFLSTGTHQNYKHELRWRQFQICKLVKLRMVSPSLTPGITLYTK